MPVPNVGQTVAQAWEAYVGTKPEDAIHDEYSQLRSMEKSKAFKSFTGGRAYIGGVEYALNTTVGWISDTGTVPTNRVDVFDEYTYPLRQIAGTVVMSSLEDAINRGSSAKFDLLEGKLESLRKSLRSQINTEIFGAQAGNEMNGLQDLVPTDPTTGTVGGINRASFSFWRSQQTSGAKTTSAYDNLRSAMRTIHAACSRGQGVMEPDYYMGTSTDVNGFESLLIANERVVSKEDSQANGGFKSTAFKFKMADVRWDRDCSASTMYALNNSNLILAYQSGYWFKGYPAVDPANQLIRVFKVECNVQLLSNNPRHLGVITSIS